MSQGITLEEVKKRLEIAERIINNITMRVEKGHEAHEALKEIKELDYNAYCEIDNYLYNLEQDLAYQRHNVIEDIIASLFNDHYIDTRQLSLNEINKLYEESGFASWMTDECEHFGFVKVLYDNTVKNALIFSCSSSAKRVELSIAVEGEVIE